MKPSTVEDHEDSRGLRWELQSASAKTNPVPRGRSRNFSFHMSNTVGDASRLGRLTVATMAEMLPELVGISADRRGEQ